MTDSRHIRAGCQSRLFNEWPQGAGRAGSWMSMELEVQVAELVRVRF